MMALPMELQVKILHEAARDLEHGARTKSWVLEDRRRATYVAFSLVSHSWAAETRRLLYRRVVLTPSSRSAQFYETIQSNPGLGLLVQEINHHGSLACQRLILHLQRLPNLRAVEGTWISRGVPTALPDWHTMRPKLDYISTDVTDPLFGAHLSSLGRWFDLKALRRLEIVGSFDGIAASLVLFDIPPTIEELAFRDLPMASLELLLVRIAPFVPRLLVLELVFQRRLSDGGPQAWAADPMISRFGRLRRLTISADDVAPLLESGSSTLETLVLGFPGIEYAQDALGADLESKVHGHVSALCRTVADQPARFPGLRQISLFPPGWGFSFATAFERAHLCEVVEMARELRDVGLKFVDEAGTAWEDEWNDEDLSLTTRVPSC